MVEQSHLEIESQVNPAASSSSTLNPTFNRKQMLMVNLQTLEQICHRLASYLESNEIANVEELSRVQ